MARALNAIVVEKYSVMIGMVWLILAHHFIVLSSKIIFSIFQLFETFIKT
jgi:hypothetical protein